MVFLFMLLCYSLFVRLHQVLIWRQIVEADSFDGLDLFLFQQHFEAVCIFVPVQARQYYRIDGVNNQLIQFIYRD